MPLGYAPTIHLKSDNGQTIGFHVRLPCPSDYFLSRQVHFTTLLIEYERNKMEVLTTGCITLLSGL